MGFFSQAVLGNRHTVGCGRYGPRLHQVAQRARWHILKLASNGISRLRQRSQAFGIVIRGVDVQRAGFSRGAARIGFQHDGAVAHALRHLHKHAP